jgi:hypothetical protein
LESADAPTGRIDYLKIQRFRINYGTESGYGGENLPSNQVARELNDQVVYLNIPQQLSTAYNANFSTVDMGAAGVLGAQLIGQVGGVAQGRSINAENIKQQLQAAAAAALPEFAYKKGASAINALAQSAGLTAGSGDPTALQALTSGRIMNPFTEQVFNGVSFRQHSFSFKMFAHNQREAQEILNIIFYLKMGAMPKYGNADMSGVQNLIDAAGAALSGATGSSAPSSASSSASGALSSFTATGAYLEVPDRFLLEFVRLDTESDTITKLPHYKFQPCVCTNVSVNYTPDGQYVSFKDAILNLSATTGSSAQIFVPAVEISIDFAETKILTQQDIAIGY